MDKLSFPHLKQHQALFKAFTLDYVRIQSRFMLTFSQWTS